MNAADLRMQASLMQPLSLDQAYLDVTQSVPRCGNDGQQSDAGLRGN
jgi:hypothetical protein